MPQRMNIRIASLILIAGHGITAGAHAQAALDQPAAAPPATETFMQEVPAAAYAFEMVRIPGDPERGIAPFWIARTEITWQAFDVFVYSLDNPEQTPGSDAVTRPSKPYLPPDRGFGHDDYAAISMSFRSAEEFCAWLSAKSGRRYRLPTEAEWEFACADAPADPAVLAETAWFADNADGKPHEVASKAPNAFGLHDMLGNVQEWCVGSDGKPVTKGGSYRDDASQLTPSARQPQTYAWNSSDPQIPKSKWWLSDAPFVGFRVVCEDD